jgi:hypothetical protein
MVVARLQQIAFVAEGVAEYGERRPNCSDGKVEKSYRELKLRGVEGLTTKRFIARSESTPEFIPPHVARLDFHHSRFSNAIRLTMYFIIHLPNRQITEGTEQIASGT